MRSRRGILPTLVLVLAIPVAGAGPSPARADPIFTDPPGRNVGVHDIHTVNATPVGGNLVFDVTFYNTITDPSLSGGGGRNDLFGFIDIDADRNPLTPHPPPDLLGARGFGGFPGLGVDFYVDLGSVLLHPGFVDVVDTADGSITGSAPVAFLPNEVVVTVPLSALSGGAGTGPLSALAAGDGLVNYGVIAVDGGPAGGNAFVSDLAPYGGPATDAPAPTVTSVAVPEPGGVALLGLGLAAAWACRRRRRRQAGTSTRYRSNRPARSETTARCRPSGCQAG
jgi:hypothetical protein